MNVRSLKEIPVWEWPENARDVLEETLRDVEADAADRLLAAELAADITVMDDGLADVLLATLYDETETEEMRGQAAVAFGPVLELADIEEFDDPGAVPIAETTFRTIVASLQELYERTDVTEGVRRRILEAAVRAPQDWHRDAVRRAYSNPDPDWKLSAVFAMQWIKGFDEEVLEALESDDENIQYEAVRAAGSWGIEAAWPHVAEVVKSEIVDRRLLLAAIEAVANIRPQEAARVLVDLIDSDDEEVAAAVDEAMTIAELASRLDGNGPDDDFLW